MEMFQVEGDGAGGACDAVGGDAVVSSKSLAVSNYYYEHAEDEGIGGKAAQGFKKTDTICRRTVIDSAVGGRWENFKFDIFVNCESQKVTRFSYDTQ